MRCRRTLVALLAGLAAALPAATSHGESTHVFGVHDWGWGVNVDVMNWLPGWVTEANLGRDVPNVGGRHEPMVGEGFTIVQRLDWDWDQTVPSNPADYPTFASQCANHWARNIKRFCRHYSIGNEVDLFGVNPAQYAACFQQVRAAIKAEQPEAKVLIGHWCDGENVRSVIRALGPGGYDGLTDHTASSAPDGMIEMLDEEGAPADVGVYVTEWGWVADTAPYDVSLAQMMQLHQGTQSCNNTHQRQIYSATWYRWPCWDHTFNLDDDCNSIDNPAFKHMTANHPTTNAYANNAVSMSGVRVEVSVTQKALVARWQTDRPARSMLWYWNAQANPENGEFVPLDSSLVSNHQMTMDNAIHVAPQTEYLLICRSPVWDAGNGNAGPYKVTTGPWTVAVQNVTGTTATIHWQTLFPSSGRVEYGLTPDYGLQTSGPSGVTDHVVQLQGLEPMTPYYYRVWSEASGYAPHHSARFTFYTGLPDPTPDLDHDDDVDQSDFGLFQACLSGAGVAQTKLDCLEARLDGDDDVDGDDLAVFLGCVSGPGNPFNPGCM